MVQREMLQQALCDAAELHMDVVGAQLAADGGTIGIGGAMQILIAITRRRGFMAAIQKW